MLRKSQNAGFSQPWNTTEPRLLHPCSNAKLNEWQFSNSVNCFKSFVKGTYQTLASSTWGFSAFLVLCPSFWHLSQFVKKKRNRSWIDFGNNACTLKGGLAANSHIIEQTLLLPLKWSIQLLSVQCVLHLLTYIYTHTHLKISPLKCNCNYYFNMILYV